VAPQLQTQSAWTPLLDWTHMLVPMHHGWYGQVEVLPAVWVSKGAAHPMQIRIAFQRSLRRSKIWSKTYISSVYTNRASWNTLQYSHHMVVPALTTVISSNATLLPLNYFVNSLSFDIAAFL
jgi:hypothetical protein